MRSLSRAAAVVATVVLALCALLSGADAQAFDASYPSDHAFCSRPGFVRVDRSAMYKSTVPVTKALCVLEYYTVCATVTGVQACNSATSACREVQYAWDNATLNPDSWASMTKAPEVCSDVGAYIHPEVAVYAVAQPVLACIVGVVCIILVAVGARRNGSTPGLWVIFSGMFFSCIFLLFGVWYLNAYLAVLVTIIAVGMFTSRQRSAVLVGLFAVFVGLLWFTYANGLGSQQHSYRLGNTSVERYEQSCNSFYKGYFADPIQFKGSFDSPLIPTRRYCLREYIGVEFFFVFFIELLFLILFAYGGYVVATNTRVKTA